jgi:hypothetical protein
MDCRTKFFWIPGLVTLVLAEGLRYCLVRAFPVAQITIPISRWFVSMHIPWSLTLPIVGVTGAYLSRRLGGEHWEPLVASLFPAFVQIIVVFMVVMANPHNPYDPSWEHVLFAVVSRAVVPGSALFLGARFLRFS